MANTVKFIHKTSDFPIFPFSSQYFKQITIKVTKLAVDHLND